MWQFCLFYGIILAFGVALVGFPPAVALVSNWFIKRRAMALGFAQAGLQVTFLIAPLIQLLIQTAGWRNAYFWLAGAIFLIIAPLSFGFLRHHPRDIGLSPDGNATTESTDKAGKKAGDITIIDEDWVSQEWTLLKALKTYRFWAIFTVVTAMSITFNMIVTHQVAHIVDIGFSAMFAASLLVIFGAMSMTGRFFGFVSDIFGRERTYMVCSLGMMLAILLLLLAGTTSSVWMLYVYMALFAFSAGLSTPTYGASVADIFHGRHFGSIIGFADLGWGLGTALGSWLGGYVFDATGSYTLAFSIAMGMIGLASLAMWIASPRKIRQVGRKKVLTG
jgi:MFS family permease